MSTHALPPTPRMITDARAVVTAPELFAHQPSLRVWSWAVLMGQRGKRVDQLRLDQMLRALRPVTLTPAAQIGGAA